MTISTIATLVGFVPLGGGTNNYAHGWTVLANDYIVIATTNLAGNPMSVTGYTAIGASTSLALFGKKMTGGETTIPIVEDAAAHQCFVAWQRRGQDLTTPEDAAAVIVDPSTGSIDCGSITTVTAFADVIAVGFVNFPGLTLTTPAGYGDFIFKERDTSPNHMVMGAIKQVASPGAEDPAVFGGTSGADGVAITWAMRPAAAAAATSLIYLSPVASFSHMLVR